MTDLLEKALEAVRMLPPDDQEGIARLMLDLADRSGVPEKINPAHLGDVLDGLAQAGRGEFATDTESKLHSAASVNEAAVHPACC
jgi:DNA-binding TFAR19-related protein (PDSD5 family)